MFVRLWRLKWLRRVVLGVLFVVGGVYGVNAAFIYFMAPANVQRGGAGVEVASIGGTRVVSFDDLHSGGVGFLGWDRFASGYVNFASPDSVIYIDKLWASNFSQKSSLYQHELTHVLQKQMIAERVGGYPSYGDPVRTFRYVFALKELNDSLRDSMPAVKDNGEVNFMTSGLEASAECFAQPYSSVTSEPVYYVAHYLKDGHCSNYQRRLAITLFSADKWFTGELSADVASELPVENITDVYDNRWMKRLLRDTTEFIISQNSLRSNLSLSEIEDAKGLLAEKGLRR